MKMVWRHLIRVLFFFSWLRTVVAVLFFRWMRKQVANFVETFYASHCKLYNCIIYVSAIFTRPNEVKHIVEYFQISKHMFWHGQKLIVLRLERKKKSRITTRESDKWKKFIKKYIYPKRQTKNAEQKNSKQICFTETSIIKQIFMCI